MAVPKRKTSKAKTASRKAANMKMGAPGLSTCPQCHAKASHTEFAQHVTIMMAKK